MAKGSTRFQSVTRQTGGGNDVISHKPSKKLKKLNSVGVNVMDQSSQSTSTNTSSKRVKLPKKFFDDCDTVTHASVPRKIRSAMKKRKYDSVSPSSPNNRNENCRSKMATKDHSRKLKTGSDERDSTSSESMAEELTEDEKITIEALLALAQITPENNNKTEEINLKNEALAVEASNKEKDDSKTCVAPVTSKSNDLVQESLQIQDRNVTKNLFGVEKDSKFLTNVNKSRKRCSSHAYICQLIKDLEATKGKQVNSHQEPEQQVVTDTIPEKIPEYITNGNVDKSIHKTSIENERIFQMPNRSATASRQVSVLPLFGSPLYDPSQWSRPLFPKQQMWMSPFIHENRTNGEMMPPGSSSYNLGIAQTSMLNGRNQLPYKMRFGDESGGLLLMDGSYSSGLNLTLR